MTFSWMVFTKSKKQQYAECQHGDIWFPFCWCGITTGTPADITVLPRLALGLSDFSFHFNVFRNNTHFTPLCNATAASWYFDYLHKVWLNKGDLVSVTFSISSWRQTGKRSQSSAHWTWGDCQSGGCLKLFWGYSSADLDGWLRHRHTNRSTQQWCPADSHLILELQHHCSIAQIQIQNETHATAIDPYIQAHIHFGH